MIQGDVALDLCTLEACGWWQGSLINADELRSMHPGLFPSADFFVLATQTCSILNPDLQKVPLVEVVAASALAADKYDPRLATGHNPRIIHAAAVNSVGEEICIEMQIHNRAWIKRTDLQTLKPLVFSLADTGHTHLSRAHQVFARWLGNSYKRVELPNELVSALERSRLLSVMEGLVKRHSEKIEGIYFEFLSGELEPGENLTPDEIARLTPPYETVVTVVAYDFKDLPALVDELKKVDEKVHPPAVPGGAKRTKRELAADEGIILQDAKAVATDAWTVADLLATVRFTNFDYMSGDDDDAQ